MLCEQTIHIHCVNLLRAITTVVMTVDDDQEVDGEDVDIEIDVTENAKLTHMVVVMRMSLGDSW